MNSKPKVFLSYAREDRDTVSKIYNYLLNNSCEPWMDIEKLLPGQDWEYEIDIAIKNTDFFIACLTTNSVVKTGYVQKELRKALAEDPQFLVEMTGLLDKAQQESQSINKSAVAGAGGTAINAGGSIVTGNNNIVGNHNSVNDQGGKK